MRRGFLAGVVLALMAAAMLALVGTADAKKKKKKHKVAPVVTATASATGSSSGQTISATATCPAGTNAVGGGFSSPTATPSSDDLLAGLASHKVGANAWLASAQLFSSGPSGPPITLTTSVYCRKGAPATTPVTSSSPVPDFSTGQTPAAANASCPAGTVQLSGGFAIDTIAAGGSPIAVPLSSNRIDPLTWQSTAIAGETGHTITSQADCARQPKAKKPKKGKKKRKRKKLHAPTEVTGDASAPDIGQSASATAACPARTFAVNGGFSSPGFSASPYFYVITESQAVGTTWRVTGFLFEDSSAQVPLRSHGYCSA